MADEKKQEIHVHHHYAAPRRRSRKLKMKRPKKKKSSEFKDLKKAISIGCNIIEQLMRLSK